ncbi:hypothetical protein HPP92_026501 [Vanilla planifolia]|uniref:KIB1-4 beta-propeller domain-containing protein n=1 Tax=Vanilla planifolia TaxID=51239 RepID=A0A835U768_VANPL|nr:hypothetical protein HPP92_026501 [Vanilla planifolia]
MVGRRFIGGSPDGWLVTLDLQLNPRILNPLTRQEFPLPSLFTLPSILTAVHYDGSISGFWYTKSCKRRNYIALEDLRDGYIKKIVLTSAPPSGVAVVLFGLGGYYHRMSLARPRDAAWTPGPEPPENTPDGHRHNLVRIADVVYDDVGQLLYAACDGNIILAIDIKTQSWKSGHPPPVVSRISYEHFVPYASIHEDNQRSLVFIGGEMLMVWRTLDFVHESRLRSADGRWEVLGPLEYHVDDHQALVETSDVRVAKYVALDRPCHDPQRPYVTEHGRWVPVDLEDVAIFLGCNHSISLPVADKRGDGMQPNSVYFTEESTRAPARRRKPYMRDAGVYDLKKKTFEKRYFPSNCKVNWPPPIWFMPSGLCKRTPA